MCGIAGFYHLNKEREADGSLLETITNCVSHRGPDGAGYFRKNNLALGHRRLSIIDLSTGDQPMFSDDKSVTIIFNGEIYNYVELRSELISLGHVFKTTSDTEVIIRSYEQWGIECQNKFNGMWAFALWDDKEQLLLLSRDRLGEKPLFYSQYDETIIFGSEIKSILAYGVPPSPNVEVTELYFTLSYLPAPYSFYKHIMRLQPGCYIMVKNGKTQIYSYWDISSIDESSLITDRKKVYNTFEELLYSSVKIRMRSDVPFGAFLSGGLDSAAIVALMSDIAKEPVRTFTIGFENKNFDERKLAALVAEKFRTEHEESLVKPEEFDVSLSKILYHFDEPFGDSSAIPTGNVSRVAVNKVKMVLTGDGGDEILSGYTPYQAEKLAVIYQALPRFITKALPSFVAGLGQLFTGGLRYKLNRSARVLKSSSMTFEKRLLSKMWSTPEFTQQLIQPGENYIKLEDYLSDLFAKYPLNDPFYKLMIYHFKVLLPDDYLTKVDRMSMAHSLETRIPFLDYRLVEFFCNVHKDVKMEGFTRKSILRNTIGRRLPVQLLSAPKKGFGVPLRDWFKNRSFEAKLNQLKFESHRVGLNSEMVGEIVEKNVSGKEDLGNLLWMLFVYIKWRKSVL
jgi:asparagine synthase (glutamine-hydrolysing)